MFYKLKLVIGWEGEFDAKRQISQGPNPITLKRAKSFLVVLFLTLLSATVTAQENPNKEKETPPTEKDVYKNGEVLVESDRPGNSGMKMDVPLKDIPATVNVVTRKEMDDRAAVDFIEALQYTAGIFAHQNYGGFNTLSMRGLDSRNVLLLRDGARDDTLLLVNSSPMSNMYGIERIEVLKGPNAVLYGQGAMAGVISLIRKKTSRTTKFETSLKAGTYGKSGEIGLTGPIFTPKFRYRVDGGAEDYQGFRENPRRTRSALLTLELDLAKSTTLIWRSNFTRDYYRTDAGLPRPDSTSPFAANIVEPGVAREDNYNTPDDFLKNQQAVHSLELKHKFNKNHRLRLLLAHVSAGYDYIAAESLSVAAAPETDLLTPDRTVERDHLRFRQIRKPVQGTLEYEAKFNLGLKHHTLLGYEHHILEFNRKLTYYPLGTTSTNLYVPEVDLAQPLSESYTSERFLHQRMNSVYFQDIITVIGPLKLLVGGRWDSWKRETRSDTLDDYDGRFTRTKGTEVRNDTKQMSGRGGLVYELMKGVTFYGAYSSSFTPSTVSDYRGRQLKPERGEQVELGQRFRLKKNFLDLNLAFFQANKYDVAVKVQNTPAVYDQAGHLRTQGFEADLKMKFSKRHYLKAGYAYVDARWKSFSTTSSSGTISYTENRPRNIPAQTIHLWHVFRFKNGLGFGLGGRYVDEIEADNGNSYQLPPYALYDLALYAKVWKLKLAVMVKNLTDKNYYASATPNPTPGTPREIVFSVSGKF